MQNIRTFRNNIQSHIREQINDWMNPEDPANARQYYYQKSIVAPTVIIPRAGEIRTIEEDLDMDLAMDMRIKNDQGASVPVREAKDNLCFDAILVHFDGKLRTRYYADEKYKEIPHYIQSNSKSMVGMVYAILVDRGDIDPGQKVVEFLPELAGTAYDDATVQQLVDMRVNAPCNDWYSMLHPTYPNGDSFELAEMVYSTQNSGWHCTTSVIEMAHRFLAKDLPTMFQEHGEIFSYFSLHTNIAAMIVESVVDRPFHEIYAAEVYAKIGASHDATAGVNCLGEPASGEGGYSVTAMDMLRLGLALQEKRIQSPYLYHRINQRLPDAAMVTGKSKHEKFEEFLKVFGEYGITHYSNFFYLGESLHNGALLNYFLGAYGQVVVYSLADDFVYVGQSSYTKHIAPPILGHVEAAQALHHHYTGSS